MKPQTPEEEPEDEISESDIDAARESWLKYAPAEARGIFDAKIKRKEKEDD